MWISELVWIFSMFSTTNDTNWKKNLLASGRILNFLNYFLQDDILLMSVILGVKYFFAVH
jgi:hypothetical protein